MQFFDRLHKPSALYHNQGADRPLTANERSPYNLLMKRAAAEEKLRTRVKDVSTFYHQKGRMPSFSEIGEMFRLSSKGSVHKAVNRLEGMGAVSRDSRGRLIPGSIKSPVRVLGTVEAGFPSPAEEELADTLSLDDLLIQNREATFLLKVSGDSMSGAGILPGDMVIVDKGQTPKSGDIVIAEVDGAWTMKYLRKRGESVTLLPANPNYKPIRPKSELKIAGVVTAVVRKYR
ncbi:MAG: repressor LexA [Nitrospirae bacterium]|nr:repressor LexA [Nitrospirota bacterium]